MGPNPRADIRQTSGTSTPNNTNPNWPPSGPI